MKYYYNTPDLAIRSLERAYTENDLEGIMNSYDFIEQAKLILQQTKYQYDLNDNELIQETAKLLQLGLIKSLKENGFPDFSDLKCEMFDLQNVSSNLFVVTERIIYTDNTYYDNTIYLSFKDNEWKIAWVKE